MRECRSDALVTLASILMPTSVYERLNFDHISSSLVEGMDILGWFQKDEFMADERE